MINNNLKIGIVYCCYGNPEYIHDCIKPWLSLKEDLFNIKIAAVNGQFKEYHEMAVEDSNLETELILNQLQKSGEIDYLYIQNPANYFDEFKIYETEAQIRDKALQFLLKEKCDVIWLLDNDEFYTEEQIENIIKYINLGSNSFESWFSIPFKNYILDGQQYLKGFCPPRIFRVNPAGDLIYNLECFYWDNDIRYTDPNGLKKDYKELSGKRIPEKILDGGVKHLTWLHSNGKNKVIYQNKHFGHCSYKWNEEKQELEIDYDFYNKNGLDLPIIYKDE